MVFADLGALRPERYTFLVKGLRLSPDSEGEDPFVRMLRPYAAIGERFVAVVSNPLGTAVEMLKTLPHGRHGIVGGSSNPLTPEDLQDLDHVVFVNEGAVQCPAFLAANKGANVSVIIDYATLHLFKGSGASYCLFDHRDPGWFTAAASDASRNLMEGCQSTGTGGKDSHPYTVIAVQPPPQTFQFVFATSDALMHVAIAQLPNPAGTAVYTRKQTENTAPNCTYTSQVAGLGSYSRLIFCDISDCGAIASALDQISDIVVLYTADDFRFLPPVVDLLSSRGIPVPEHIRRIAQHK